MNSVANGLEEVKKKAEETLIRFFTASHNKSTSETRKQVVKEMEKSAVQNITRASEKYLDSFSNSVQGKWSKAANVAFKQTIKALKAL